MCLSDSICLISDRADVIHFCQLAIGHLNEIRVITDISVAVCNFSAVVLIDAACISSENHNSILKQLHDVSQNIICLLPPDLMYKQSYMETFFEFVLPVPCEVEIFQSAVHNLNSFPEQFHNHSFLLSRISSTDNPVFQNFYGKSSLLKSLKREMEEVAQNDRPVLLVGETGTGKTTIARLIHKLSRRNGAPFCQVSIPNIPEEVTCSTLFGTRKGAFTDAVENEGLFKSADGGTVFLDEIGFATHRIQGNLLTFIENGMLRRMGSDIDEKVNVRLIFATNANLTKMRSEGAFREDFYHRISTFKIHLPALRDHVEDVEEIIAPLLEKNHKSLDKYAYEKLINHNWPGNIRELLNCIEKACTYCKSPVITADYILFDL